MKLSRNLTIIICLFLICSCLTKKATLKTYIDPSIQSASIKKVGVFPIRNTAFSPGEAIEMDRSITQGFFQKNNNITLVNTSESISLINKENLSDEFAKFLHDFESSGIPNTTFLHIIKSKFDMDAILQGKIFDVQQNDRLSGKPAQTSLAIRYTLLSTSNGSILWEGTSNCTVEYGRTKGRFAPPFYEAATLGKDRIIISIPVLSR